MKLDADVPDNIKKEYSCEECNKILSRKIFFVYNDNTNNKLIIKP
jgi:hypothetical protein